MNNKHEQLATLFKEDERPTIKQLEMSADRALVELHVPENLSWFAGHFPDHKVLPGIVQIDWAGKLGRALFIEDWEFRDLINVKFKTMVMPATDINLELVYDADKGNLKFHFFNAQDSFSVGSLKFSPR